MRPGGALAVAALLLACGASILFIHEQRQTALDHKLIEAIRRAHYAEARALLDRGADANARNTPPQDDRWQVLTDIWRQVRGMPRPRERFDPPLLLCRPRVERSR